MSGEAPRVCAARVTGVQHLRRGEPCQDAFLVEQDGDSALLAVADGHTKSRHGDQGAELAVQAAVGVFRWVLAEEEPLQTDRDLRGLRGLVLEHLRGQLVRTWRRLVQGRAPHGELVDFGSTLLCALWTPRYLLQIQLGDGDLILVEGGCARSLAPVEEGQVGDETLSLASPAAEHSVHALLRPPPRGEALLLLATDGYGKSYDDGDAMLGVALDYHHLAREHGFAEIERRLPGYLGRVTEGGSGDDIACALAWSTGARADAGGSP